MLSGPTLIPHVVSSAVIMLHGFGSDGQDLIGLAPYMQAALPETAIYAPNGVSPVAFGQGYQWFSDNNWTFKDRDGMNIAQEQLEAYIQKIMTETKLPAEKIVLMGFSQGTMTALFVAPRMKEKLAGVVGLSGRMFWDEELEGTTYHKIPVRLVHGLDDDVVDPNSTPEAVNRLHALGFDVEGVQIPHLGHGIDDRALTKTIEYIQFMLKGA